jgi:hydrogenase nickel incorporation protein HypA/HybF
MHELSITESILNQSIAEAKKQHATEIKLIKLKIGEGMSIVPECMQFYFETMRKDTLAANALLEIETVLVKVVCPKCRTEIKDLNPTCKCQAGAEIVSGQDLSIEYIDIETGPEEKIHRQGTKNTKNPEKTQHKDTKTPMKKSPRIRFTTKDTKKKKLG